MINEKVCDSMILTVERTAEAIVFGVDGLHAYTCHVNVSYQLTLDGIIT